MNMKALLVSLTLLLPLTAQALPTVWNVDDPTGGFIGSFTYSSGGVFDPVFFNATTGNVTEEWTSADAATSTGTEFNSGPGTFFDATLQLLFGTSLETDPTGPVLTEFTTFNQGMVFSTGTFQVTTSTPPDYPRPQPTPAPGTLLLMGLGVVALGLNRRRKLT